MGKEILKFIFLTGLGFVIGYYGNRYCERFKDWMMFKRSFNPKQPPVSNLDEMLHDDWWQPKKKKKEPKE